MSDSLHQRLRTKLLAQRTSLEAVSATGAQASKTVELDQSRVGRLSRMDALQEQAMSQERERRRTLELKAIAAALQRLDAGEFGECIECGEDIAAARLEFNPSVALCLECASAAEQ
ncbi:MAG: TraR/DksA C4-type zinc finger protein [Pseudomonadota bacterium]